MPARKPGSPKTSFLGDDKKDPSVVGCFCNGCCRFNLTDFFRKIMIIEPIFYILSQIFLLVLYFTELSNMGTHKGNVNFNVWVGFAFALVIIFIDFFLLTRWKDYAEKGLYCRFHLFFGIKWISQLLNVFMSFAAMVYFMMDVDNKQSKKSVMLVIVLWVFYQIIFTMIAAHALTYWTLYCYKSYKQYQKSDNFEYMKLGMKAAKYV